MNVYRDHKPEKCRNCAGDGWILEWTGMGSESETCRRCNGTGEEPSDPRSAKAIPEVKK